MKDEMIKELGKNTMDKLDKELEVNSSLQNVSHCDTDDEDTTTYIDLEPKFPIWLLILGILSVSSFFIVAIIVPLIKKITLGCG